MSTQLKDLQLAILLEGSASYLMQFSVDKNLRERALVLRKQHLLQNRDLAAYLTTDVCREQTRQTILFFAKQDGLLSESLAEACNVKFAPSQPWSIAELPVLTVKPSNKLFTRFLQQYDDGKEASPNFLDEALVRKLTNKIKS
jgi:hypothetical protein